MREILFRGMRADNKKWIEGSLIVDYPCCKNKVDKSVKQYFILDLKTSDEKVKSVQVIPETIGQYTGLTDKNGKKIFEGDIVRYYGTYDLEVYIEKGHTKIRWVDTVTGRTETELFFGYDEEAYGECEIIGNIHDNPELLKGGV